MRAIITAIIATSLTVPTVRPALAEEPPQEETEGPVLDLEGDASEEGPDLDLPEDEAGQEGEATDVFGDLTEKVAGLAHRTILGGYGEIEFHKEKGKDSNFLAHRFVLFVHSQISPRISASTEIEWEFGGSPSKKDGVQGTGEVLLEFAVVDFMLTDWLTLRGGIILVPFGAFNIRHDAPTRDLTERPKPLTTITPTTWFEAGAGILGDFGLGGDASLSYELYAINGLDSKINEEFGLKGAVGSKLKDNNGDKAVVGRVAVSPTLGLEVAASGYTGEYDDVGNRINMLGADFTWRLGRVEFLGEYVRAFIDEGFVEGFDEGSPANTRQAVPTGMQGFYAQTNIHFQVPGLWSLLPEDLQDSELTAAVRYEHTDTNLDEVNEFDLQKLTFGLNYRPVEAFAIKQEVQLISRSTGGVKRHVFSGRWDPTPNYVASMAYLF
ncbi:MAG: porin [Myxococcota bacterium]